jgi:hypothetical protein
MVSTTTYLPTQTEILEACSGIRGSWSELERERRAMGLVNDLTIPTAELAKLLQEGMYASVAF